MPKSNLEVDYVTQTCYKLLPYKAGVHKTVILINNRFMSRPKYDVMKGNQEISEQHLHVTKPFDKGIRKVVHLAKFILTLLSDYNRPH